MTKSGTFAGTLNTAWPNFGQSPTRVTITAPSQGFVLVQFEGTFYTFDGSCTSGCNAIVRVKDLANNAVSPYQEGSTDKVGVNGTVTVPATWIFPVSAGTRQFAFEHSTETGINKILWQNASMTAVFIPFGGTGSPGVLGPAGAAKIVAGKSSIDQ
jgi:hypothetical protein